MTAPYPRGGVLDEHGNRQCRHCGEFKPNSRSHFKGTPTGNPGNCCKVCDAARAAGYREVNGSSYEPRSAKDRYMRRMYGIGVDEFERMKADQGGECAICNTREPGGHGDFHVDHCHTTGRVRGVLCMRCNLVVG